MQEEIVRLQKKLKATEDDAWEKERELFKLQVNIEQYVVENGRKKLEMGRVKKILLLWSKN